MPSTLSLCVQSRLMRDLEIYVDPLDATAFDKLNWVTVLQLCKYYAYRMSAKNLSHIQDERADLFRATSSIAYTLLAYKNLEEKMGTANFKSGVKFDFPEEAPFLELPLLQHGSEGDALQFLKDVYAALFAAGRDFKAARDKFFDLITN